MYKAIQKQQLDYKLQVAKSTVNSSSQLQLASCKHYVAASCKQQQAIVRNSNHLQKIARNQPQAAASHLYSSSSKPLVELNSAS